MGNVHETKKDVNATADKKEARRNEMKRQHANAVVKKKLKEFEQCSQLYIFADEKIGEVKESTSKLKDFILKIIEMELSVYSLSHYLGNLYLQLPEESDVQNELDACKAKISKEYNNDISDVEGWIRKYNRQILELENKKVPEDRSPLPKKPIEPQKPLLQQAGFFNKKKVALENEALIEIYEKEQADYEAQLVLYESQIKERENAYLQKQKNLEKEKQKEKEELLKMISEMELKRKALVEKKERELPIRFAEIPKTNKMVLREFYISEIEEAEKTLKQMIQIKKAFYESGIVYKKYQDIVALSTFNEYLTSGRCDSLEGNNGAYNLYETELRANLIISKLDDIVVSLEKVKENQFYIYSELRNVNKEIKDMNSKMEKMAQTIENMENSILHIEMSTQNAAVNSNIIAYNTERSAYYAKKNAQLTNALGFLVALK